MVTETQKHPQPCLTASKEKPRAQEGAAESGHLQGIRLISPLGADSELTEVGRLGGGGQQGMLQEGKRGQPLTGSGAGGPWLVERTEQPTPQLLRHGDHVPKWSFHTGGIWGSLGAMRPGRTDFHQEGIFPTPHFPD